VKRIKKFGDFDDLDFISESRVYFMSDLLLKLRELRDEPQFPYMDTFKHYDVQSSILSNYDGQDRGFKLQDTTGNYYAKGTNTQKTIDKATNFIRRFKDYLK
jgi:hypothetical protein